jgi:hypothetical protein
MTKTVKRVRRGSIVYTDKWRGYDSLMFCGYKHLNIDHKYKFKKGTIYINGIEGFWSFCEGTINQTSWDLQGKNSWTTLKRWSGARTIEGKIYS